MIHHFVLKPNIYYTADLPVSANNLPYHESPELAQIIDSPVRLFASPQMTLGKYGTAVWFDSHTEDYFGQSDRGQRLAGRVLDTRLCADRIGDVSGQAPNVMASTVFGVRELDGWIRLAIDEEEGRLAVGCVDGDIVLFEYI
jgi:hypothetical protein